ncbi:hypothetical protein GCM10027578_09730 [Spirosoma luteolum]
MANPLFSDSRLLRHIGLTLVSSALILVCIKITSTIHLPYFVTPALAAGLGFLEPRRGWILAFIQVAFLWLTYTLFFGTPDGPADRDVENFGLYGSMILTLIGSFLGGLIKRTFDRGNAPRR